MGCCPHPEDMDLSDCVVGSLVWSGEHKLEAKWLDGGSNQCIRTALFVYVDVAACLASSCQHKGLISCSFVWLAEGVALNNM